jgi:hypothetical protein
VEINFGGKRMKKPFVLYICFCLFHFSPFQKALCASEFKAQIHSLNDTPKEKIALEEIMSIGVKDGDENYMFYSPRSVCVSDSGDIYVLDANNYRIQKYDKGGKYVLSIGRKGQGPGEILGCQDMELDSAGNIVIFDFENSRVSTFSPDGTFVRAVKLGFPPIKGAVDSENNIYIYYRHNLKLIHKYDPEGNHILSFMDELKVNHPRLVTNVTISGQMTVFKDKIYLLLPYPYTIYVFDTNGKKLNTISIKGDYPEQPFVAPDGTVIMNFTFTGLSISPEGHICNIGIYFKIPENWKDELKEIISNLNSYTFMDIFSLDGEKIGHMKFPGLVGGGCFDSKDFYYAIIEDEGGYCRIIKNVLKIVE